MNIQTVPSGLDASNMARKRMIDPEFWLDEDISSLSAYARLLYIGLWGICDDNYATLPNRPGWIKAQIFPYEEVNIQELLDELSSSTRIILFTGKDGREYFYIKNFFKYQKVDRPSAPKYPQFESKSQPLDEGSTSTRPEVKLSKVKLSKVNEQNAIAFSETTNDLISLFKDINPNYEKLYPNKTQRAALERMVTKHGYEKVRRSIQFAVEVNGQKYAPRISTPLQLEDKMGDLITYAKSRKADKPLIAVMPKEL